MAGVASSPTEGRSTPPRGAAAPARAGRELAGRVVWSLLRRVVMTSAGLRAVNHLHRRLGLGAKRRFFYLCFDETCTVDGPWIVDFGGRRLVLPLHRTFHLAWIAAIGFHGHDTEIHQFYETAVRAQQPPRVFFDVGACYGLHSLKLLAHGVRVVSFEPNPDCHPFLMECGERNRLRPEIHAVAVGARAGTAELAVPGGQTYLGTVTDAVKAGWRGRPDITSRVVPQVALDSFAADRQLVPDLVKIDAEGNELTVLQGARHLLETARPRVLLESWPASGERAALFQLLDAHGYRLHPLVFPAGPGGPLPLTAFLDSPALNFLAQPARVH